MKIVCLGDSITAGNPGFQSPVEAPPDGAGDPRSQYAYWVMQAHPEWRLLNRGIGGDRTDQMLRRFDRHVATERPDAVVLLGGLNDLYQGATPLSVKKNLRAIYERCMADAFRVVACTLIPLTGSTLRFQGLISDVNQWVRGFASNRRLGFCDLYEVMRDPRNLGTLRYSDDGVHPNVAGYKKMGEVIATSLADILEGDSG